MPPRAVLIEASGVVPSAADLARPTTPALADDEHQELDDAPPGPPVRAPGSAVRRRGVPVGQVSRGEARRLEEELRRRFLDRPGRTP